MKNSVILLDYGGGDLSHARAGWASTGGLTEEKRKRIPEFLMRLGTSVPRHTVPFEHSWLQFSVTCETASHIQILKHRTLSVNAESARYRELIEDKHHVPEDWHEDGKDFLARKSEEAYENYHFMLERLQETGLTRKRAKESARYFLPYAIQVQLVVSGNFHAFSHFWMLRNSPDAQLEIREIAAEMLRLVEEETNGIFQHSIAAWGL